MFGSSKQLPTPTPVFAAPAALAPSAAMKPQSTTGSSTNSRFGTTLGTSMVNSMSRTDSNKQRKVRALMGA